MLLRTMRALLWASFLSISTAAATAAQSPFQSSSRVPICVNVVFTPDSTTYRSIASILAAGVLKDSTAPLPPADTLAIGGSPDTTLFLLDTIPWRGDTVRPGAFLAQELQRPGAILDPTGQGLWQLSGDTLVITAGGYGWLRRYRISTPYFDHAGTGTWSTHMGYDGYGRASLSQVDCR